MTKDKRGDPSTNASREKPCSRPVAPPYPRTGPHRRPPCLKLLPARRAKHLKTAAANFLKPPDDLQSGNTAAVNADSGTVGCLVSTGGHPRELTGNGSRRLRSESPERLHGFRTALRGVSADGKASIEAEASRASAPPQRAQGPAFQTQPAWPSPSLERATLEQMLVRVELRAGELEQPLALLVGNPTRSRASGVPLPQRRGSPSSHQRHLHDSWGAGWTRPGWRRRCLPCLPRRFLVETRQTSSYRCVSRDCGSLGNMGSGLRAAR